MLIEARKLNKTYNVGKSSLKVLKDINLKIDRGEFISIVGPSGAGKSTLLHLLGGIDYPTDGEVFFNNINLYSLPEPSLARLLNSNIGFVFQFYHLLPDFSALENVLLPAMVSGRDAFKEANELLSKFGLSERSAHFPYQLSGGEQQRIAIIRALINRPEVLFCDEPTGNLDSKNGKEIISMLKYLNRENSTTVVLVTHDINVAEDITGRVVHLRDGEIVHIQTKDKGV